MEVLIHTFIQTKATWGKRTCPRFETASVGLNPGPLDLETCALPTRPPRPTVSSTRETQGCPIGIPKNPEISGSNRISSLGAAAEVDSARAKESKVKSGGGGGSRTQNETQTSDRNP